MSTTHTVTMGERGRLVMPADLRRRHQWGHGASLILVETDEGVLLTTRSQLKARVRKQLEGRSLSEELTKERRRAAAEEDLV